MGGSGTRSCGRTDHESCELSEHHCGSIAPLHGVCLPNWKWNLPAEQRPMSWSGTQAPPCPNISTLCDRCLDIWYNLSPVMYQKLVASLLRRVAAVLKAKRRRNVLLSRWS
ncbi:hypothetical protein AVEN_216935-1 [Araneus ventricosus]|uniref:Uncharacterized protein n=1 Tax=Araneus ventricosus TaxID=182803 RepID=A0A4Y2UFU1_ARAVE|nr:hypothetical protein AVEN_246743-1 [Araneus ventricosus]GBO10676.1 hypothetical protein AVEN_18630-1 [Araneus ventricosus]GBO11935.1 hypothetical protein AVEN_24905-1 [Araneus ventricosus]GBO11944.1 hypothetical protein AVEN_216935-1 [Araneus ventricosus]